MDFAYKLGKIFYQGSIYAAGGGIASGSEGVGRVLQDFEQAQYYFLQIARQVWPRDPTNPLQHKASAYKAEGVAQPGWAPKSAAYLGRMYMRDEGVKQDYEMATMWFERGAEYGDRECHNALGILWREGLVKGRKDTRKALEYFAIAAGQELAEAHVNLGKHHYGQLVAFLEQVTFSLPLQPAGSSSWQPPTSKQLFASDRRSRHTSTLPRSTL